MASDYIASLDEMFGSYPMSEPIDEAKKKNNPWAICGKNIKDQDSAKYERCVKKVKKKTGYHESTVEDIADLIDEEVSEAGASSVVPFVFEHLSQLNDDTIKFEKMTGDSIVFTVMQDGAARRYTMKVESTPETPDPATRARQMRGGAAQSGSVGEAY